MSKNLQPRRPQKVSVLLGVLAAVLGIGAWLLGGDFLGQKASSVAVQLGPATAYAAESKPPAKDKAEKKQLWTCGMHPNVIQDEPGNCPICGMKLVPLRTNDDAEAEPAGSSEGKGKILFYRNPMDPTITSPVPRKDEMGMDYVPVYENEAKGVANQGATVTIDPTTQQNMNVIIAAVTRGDMTRQIRTVGYLDYDQDKMVSVTTRYSGFIEKSHVDHVGQPIKRGEPLLEIYSPELVQTQQELLSAKNYVARLRAANAGEGALSRAQALLEAARSRLEYWDIAPQQIAEVERSAKAQRTLTVVAPASGVVMKLMSGLTGMSVKPGMELLHIADVSDLWLNTEVFDEQLPWVNEGSSVQAVLTYFPGEKFDGRIRYVSPEVSEKTRTIQVTLEFPNHDGRLRAGMYATVTFEPVVAHDVITVPNQAVLRTGERDLVIVALGKGRFAPRKVVLGAAGDGKVEVKEGLSDGERIVTSGQFLIDSESNLRAAIMKMIAEKQH